MGGVERREDESVEGREGRMSGWRGEGEMNVSVMEGVDSTTRTCI